MRRVKVKIHGKVQGISFRAFVRNHAKKLNLNGFVKNLDDGTAEAVFEGEDKSIEKILELCKKGSLLTNVNNLDVIEEEFKNEFEDFQVLY